MPNHSVPQTLVDLLESEDFYVDVAIANTPDALFRRLSSHPNVAGLAEFVDSSPENASAILRYASGLTLAASGRYRSQKDIALGACVIVLSRTGTRGVKTLLNKLRASKEFSLRWAAQLAGIASENSIDTIDTELTFSRHVQLQDANTNASWTPTPSDVPSTNTTGQLVAA